MAEQHLHIANARPGYIGSIATALDVPDAVQFAGQRAVQVGGVAGWPSVCVCWVGKG